MDGCMSYSTMQLDGFMCRNLQNASDHSIVFLKEESSKAPHIEVLEAIRRCDKTI